jgi:hypothetical protein
MVIGTPDTTLTNRGHTSISGSEPRCNTVSKETGVNISGSTERTTPELTRARIWTTTRNQNTKDESSEPEVMARREVKRTVMDSVVQFVGSANLSLHRAVGDATVKFVSGL